MEDVSSTCNGRAPGRFTVRGLLSEVDSPGEWWYDRTSQLLYIYPLGAEVGGGSLGDVRLGVPSAGAFATISNSSWVTVRDLTLSGSVATLVRNEGGEHNTIHHTLHSYTTLIHYTHTLYILGEH
jgi:hypothetical protein